MRIESTDASLRVLSERSELYDYGDKAVVYVANHKATSRVRLVARPLGPGN